MEPNSGLSPTIITLGGSVMAVLVSVVGYLWKALYDNFKQVRIQLQECEDDRKKMQEQMLQFAKELGELKGKVASSEATNKEILNRLAEKGSKRKD